MEESCLIIQRQFRIHKLKKLVAYPKFNELMKRNFLIRKFI